MKITTSLQLQAELRGQLWLTAGVLFHFASLFLLSLFGFFNVLKLPTLSLRVHVQLSGVSWHMGLCQCWVCVPQSCLLFIICACMSVYHVYARCAHRGQRRVSDAPELGL